ncbi:MAG: hypothetical protein AB2693_12550 [Candidatus Thiodiazotropha sp.]
MKLLNKSEQRARLEHKSATIAIQELLTGYRSTPHPATGVAPYEAMLHRPVPIRTKLDYTKRESGIKCSREEELNRRDREYKMKIKENAENKNTKSHSFAVGDFVLVKQDKTNKWTPPYEPIPYIVYKVRGSSVWARRTTDGREVCRDSTFFKYTNRIRQPEKGRQHSRETDDWREHALRKAKEGRQMGDRNKQTVTDLQNDSESELLIQTVPRRSQRMRQRPNDMGTSYIIKYYISINQFSNRFNPIYRKN